VAAKTRSEHKRRGPVRPGAAPYEDLGLAVVVVDHDGRVVEAPGWERAFGLAAPVCLESGSESTDGLLNGLSAVLDECRRSAGPVRRLLAVPLDRVRYYAVSAARLRGDAARGRRAILVQEITQGMELGPREGDALRQLAHDLRSPLTSMQGAIDLLQAGRVGQVTADQSRLLGMLQKSLEMMLSLVEDASARARKAQSPGGRRAAV
jgi:signal transduction histidine kinase